MITDEIAGVAYGLSDGGESEHHRNASETRPTLAHAQQKHADESCDSFCEQSQQHEDHSLHRTVECRSALTALPV